MRKLTLRKFMGNPVDGIGVRVRLTGKHPWTGHTGTIVRWGKTLFGTRPVVKLDPADDVPAGQECFIIGKGEAVPVG
jgi:hypothetical protein